MFFSVGHVMSYLRLCVCVCVCVCLICLHRRNHLTATPRRVKFTSNNNNNNKDHIFNIYAQNIDCGYTSTHNLCFRSELRKKSIPLHPPPYFFFDKKVGFKGVNISRSCFPDVKRRGEGEGGEWGRMIDCIQPLTLADCSVSV